MLKTISLFSLLSVSSLFANDRIQPTLQMGFDWGGTTLATVQHDYEANNDIKAGEGLSFEAGATLNNPQTSMELQFLVGYKFNYDSASNGDVTWDTIPFTALALFKADKWKFGGGATYHLNPHLSGSFSGYDASGTYFNDSVNDKYDNAVGAVAQIQYMASDTLAFGLKGTFIEYKLKNDSSQTARGDSIGLLATYTFGNERTTFR